MFISVLDYLNIELFTDLSRLLQKLCLHVMYENDLLMKTHNLL